MAKKRISRNFFSILGLLALLIGLPIGLLLSGSPIPIEFESIESLRRAVENPNSISSQSVFDLGRLLLWGLWVYFVGLVILEITRSSRKISLPLIGPLLKKLISTALILSSASTSVVAQPADAAVLVDNDKSDDDSKSNSSAVPGSWFDEVPAKSSFHTSEFGDSWMSLAEQYLGDASKWGQVQNLNIGRIVGDGVLVSSRTEIIQPGWRLKVPTGSNRLDDIDEPDLSEDNAFDLASFVAGLGVGAPAVAAVVVNSLKRRRQSAQATAARGKYATFGSRSSSVEAALKAVAVKERGSEIISFGDLPVKATDISQLPTPQHRLKISSDYFVTISSGLKLDLWRIGTWNVFGSALTCSNLLRSILLELDCVADHTEVYVSNSLGSEFRDFSGSEILPAENLVDRVAPGDEPGEYLTLLIFSCEDYELVKPNLESVKYEEGIAVLFVGASPLADIENRISLKADGTATLIPDDRSFKPQQLEAEAAEVIRGVIEAKPTWNELQKTTTQTKYVNLRVLGPVVCEQFSELSSQQLSLVTFLAVNGPTRKDKLMEFLWDGQLISAKRFANLLADTRKIVGREILPPAQNGKYQIHGVMTDIELLRSAVAVDEIDLRRDSSAQIEELELALGFVAGQPFEGSHRRYWSWVSEHNHVYAEAECLIRDVALALSEIYLAEADFERVAQVCLHALRGVPLDETLTARLAEAFVRLGKHTSATRLVDDWELRVSSLGFVDPSTSPREILRQNAMSPLEPHLS